MIGLADKTSSQYRLFIEAGVSPGKEAIGGLAKAVNDQLSKLNIEFQVKRKTGRLLPLILYWLKSETGAAYKAHCVANGQREGQIKTVALQFKSNFSGVPARQLAHCLLIMRRLLPDLRSRAAARCRR